MKNKMIVWAFASLWLTANARDKDPIDPPKLTITKVATDFYVYTTYHEYAGTLVSANAMYVVTKDGVVLIDCPWDSTQFQPLLDSIALKHHKKVLFQVSTHAHDDRAGAIGFFRKKGITTYTFKLTDSLLQEEHAPRSEKVFAKDTSFAAGDHPFDIVFPGAGHTPDNIVLWFPGEKILYGGCFVKSQEAINLGNVEEADVNAWKKGIRMLIDRYGDARHIITGHDDWKDLRSLKHTQDLLLVPAP